MARKARTDQERKDLGLSPQNHGHHNTFKRHNYRREQEEAQRTADAVAWCIVIVMVTTVIAATVAFYLTGE